MEIPVLVQKEKKAMKRMLTILAMVLATASAVLGQTGKVEQVLTQMERDWVAAASKADVAPLGGILADIKSGTQKLDSITLGEMKVRVFGDSAVVTGSDDEKSSYKGKDTSGHYV